MCAGSTLRRSQQTKGSRTPWARSRGTALTEAAQPRLKSKLRAESTACGGSPASIQYTRHQNKKTLRVGPQQTLPTPTLSWGAPP